MPHLSTYVGLADRSEKTLADSFRTVAEGHAHVADIFHTCHTLAQMSDTHRELLAPAVERYGDNGAVDEPERLHAPGLADACRGEIGLLRDLQDLHTLADFLQTTWTVIAQGAQGLRDRQLLEISRQAGSGTSRQLSWLDTRIKAAAPQALIVTPAAHRVAASRGDT